MASTQNSDTAESCNLIINYIPNTISDDVLRAMFSPYGNILQCKVVKDRNTGTSMGYGFVLYDSKAAGEKAIAALNGHNLENKRLKVSVARPHGEKRGGVEGTNLYICGLPQHMTQDMLDALVSPFGTVSDSKVIKDLATGQAKGIAFTPMSTVAEAKAAIAGLHGTTPQGYDRALTVKFADTPSQSQQRRQKSLGYGPSHSQSNHRYNPMGYGRPPAGPPSSYGYGGFQPAYPQYPGYSPAPTPPQAPYSSYPPAPHSMPPAYPPQPPTATPSAYPPAAPSATPTPPAYSGTPYTDPNQPYATPPAQQPYQTQQAPAQTQYVIDPMTGQYVLSSAAPPPRPQSNRNYGGVCLFVYHLPADCDEAALNTLFANYGTVLNTKVMKDLSTGRSKGFGFVNMGDTTQAQLAIQSLNGYQMGSKYLKVSFKK